MSIIEKRFSNMNKGSKLLMRIAFFTLLACLVAAIALILTDVTGLFQLKNQNQLVQWIILYAFRAWVLLFTGSLILDYLVGGKKE